MRWMYKWSNVAIDLVLLVAINIVVSTLLFPSYAVGGEENIWRTCCACAISLVLSMSVFFIGCVLDNGADSSIAQDVKFRLALFVFLCIVGYSFTFIGVLMQWGGMGLLESIGIGIVPALIGGVTSGACLALFSPFNIEGMKKMDEQLRG